MICGGRIYKGQDNYIELYVPDASGITGIEIYTGGELKITPEEYEIVDDNTIGINLTKEELDPLDDGVIYYTVTYDGGSIKTNSNYYLKTPVGYTASTLDELIEEAYEEGYEDGQEYCTGGTCDGVYESGYTDGYESGYTEGYESGSTSGYEEGYASGSTDGYNSGHTDGEAEQKAKLTSTSITENNIYTREDGWNYVTVNVPQTGHTDEELHDAYDSGFTQGEAAQKAKLVATAVTENGIYTREDGFSSVSVNVPQTGYTQQDLDNAYASGYTDGYQSGYTSGYTDGQATCEDCDDAYDSGYTDGYESGYTDGSHSCLVYVQDLIDEGYADVVTGANGTYIEILSGCPYEASQVIDLKEVATNTKQLSGSTANVIVWDQPKATGFTDTDIAGLYSGETLNFTPRGGLLWGLGNIDNFSITFAPGSLVASDYPWGSYHSEGVFAPRYDAENEPYYYSAGFRNTPKNLTVTIDGGYSSVGQVMFTMMKTTTAFTLNVNGFNCHDVTGMFEADTELETLNINGRFYWSSFRTMHNLFDGCNSLTGIPINIDLARDHDYNTIYPHNDGTRGSANCRNMFRNCSSLTYLGPTFNMKAISLSGCVVDNISQEALAGTLFDCPLLSDVHIINLNNNDWNFADASTYTYIPNMSAASIEYLLNNVEDVTSQGGHSVTFANTYKNNVPASAITYAQSMGWNVVWDGDTPVPTGSTAVAITYSIPENSYATNITAGKASSFSDATLDGTTPINIKSSTYNGRYMFADAGTHIIEFTPTGDTIGTREFAYTCVKITDVVLPEGITTIGAECFSGCRMLTGVTLCNSLATIGAQAFMNCSAMTEFHITSGVTTINGEALRNCSALTGITIPSSVTYIGEEVFEGCSGLTEMVFEGTTPPTPGNDYALGNTTYVFPIYVPAGSVSAYQTAYPNYASRITTK